MGSLVLLDNFVSLFGKTLFTLHYIYSRYIPVYHYIKSVLLRCNLHEKYCVYKNTSGYVLWPLVKVVVFVNICRYID